MTITLDGALGFIFTICTLATAVTIMVLGTYVLWSWLIFEKLLPKALMYLKLYHRFYWFIWAYERRKAFLRRRKKERSEWDVLT